MHYLNTDVVSVQVEIKQVISLLYGSYLSSSAPLLSFVSSPIPYCSVPLIISTILYFYVSITSSSFSLQTVPWAIAEGSRQSGDVQKEASSRFVPDIKLSYYPFIWFLPWKCCSFHVRTCQTLAFTYNKCTEPYYHTDINAARTYAQ